MEPQLVIAMMHRLCLMTRDNPVLRWGVECKQPLAILTPPLSLFIHVLLSPIKHFSICMCQ